MWLQDHMPMCYIFAAASRISCVLTLPATGIAPPAHQPPFPRCLPCLFSSLPPLPLPPLCLPACLPLCSACLQDALDEIARQRPKDLFKPLRVHFIGEDGIDAGGVKKEFFQLLVTELLCPDYGMLIYQPESRTYWFNPTTLEADAEFLLLGLVSAGGRAVWGCGAVGAGVYGQAGSGRGSIVWPIPGGRGTRCHWHPVLTHAWLAPLTFFF